MKISRTLSALFVVAILAPMPAAASGLTTVEQGRPVRRSTGRLDTLRERMAERRAILAERRQSQLKRSESLRAENRERRLTSARAHDQLQRRLRMIKRRIVRRRAVHRFERF